MHNSDMSGVSVQRTKTQRALQRGAHTRRSAGHVWYHTGCVCCSTGRKPIDFSMTAFSPDCLHPTQIERVLQTELAPDAHLGRVRPQTGCVRPHIGRVQPIRAARNDLQLLPLIPCANTKVFQHLCMCVSIFQKHFSCVQGIQSPSGT